MSHKLKELLKGIRFSLVGLAAVFLLFSCAAPVLKPWDDSIRQGIRMEFTDEDQEENRIGGTVYLRNAPRPDPTFTHYLIYWSSSATEAGKGARLAQVPVAISGEVLYQVPSGTPLAGQYFLLFLIDKERKELFSGVQLKIEDKFLTAEEKAAIAAEEARKAEEAKIAEPPPVAEEPVKTEDVAVADEIPKTEATGVAAEEPKVEAVSVGKEEPVGVEDASVAEEEPVKEEAPVKAEAVSVAEEAPVKAETASVVEEEPVKVEEASSESVIQALIIDHVRFDFDRSELKADYKTMLDERFGPVENKAELMILIEGHADERGSNEYNLALGERRAYAVKAYLISLGLSPDNIDVISYGEEKPLDPRHNEEAWAKNRRAETTIED
jgi:peptidoglycan-associated lipoprotein